MGMGVVPAPSIDYGKERQENGVQTMKNYGGSKILGRTPTGACNSASFSAFEKVLRRVLRSCLAVGFNGKKGSKKGC